MGGRSPCDSPAGGARLEDQSAELRVVDAVAPGGANRQVNIRLALTHATRVAGYFAEIDTGGILEDHSPGGRGLLSDGIVDLSETFSGGMMFAISDSSSESLDVGYLAAVIADVAIPPRGTQAVAELQLCLAPGVRAGTYPLTLTSAELADAESGRRIDPKLVSGSVTILEDVEHLECTVGDSEPDAERLHVTYELGEVGGVAGGEVEMPIIVTTSDHAVTHGMQLSIDFDPNVLELRDVEEILERSDENPWEYRRLQIDNAAGTLVGRFHYGSTRSNHEFPRNEEFTALGLRFGVHPGTTETETEVRFADGNLFCFHPETADERCYPYDNAIFSHGQSLPAAHADSFVFINGKVNIIGEVSTFIRGDSNSDVDVDITDARVTLNYLFLGAPALLCEDAADANGRRQARYQRSRGDAQSALSQYGAAAGAVGVGRVGSDWGHVGVYLGDAVR